MRYSAVDKWNHIYSQSKMAYPAEGVIRILKGEFPNLRLPKPNSGQLLLDLGFGDGRHIPLCASLGIEVSGVEISQHICDEVRTSLEPLNIKVDLRVGVNSCIPFEEQTFDYLLSWNSCYYMSVGEGTFDSHVDEMSRVLKPAGWIICSIPKATNFIFSNSRPLASGYRLITDDYFNGARNGEVMRCFQNRGELEEAFSQRFINFCHADIDMDWFGLNYHWFVFCAQQSDWASVNYDHL